MKKSNQTLNDSDNLGKAADLPELRENLLSRPGNVDEELCQAIMRAVSEIAPSQAIAVESRFRPWLLLGAAAAMIALLAVFWAFFPPQSALETPVIAEATASNLPEKEEGPFQALADTLNQQALLQRDARKLSIHLRENVILFQPRVTE